MDKNGSDADVIFNRASVALAKSQRLIASWLPPKTEEERAKEKTQEEIDKEENELFAPVPELLGVGAPVPKDVTDGTLKRRELGSNDALLQKLIGKKAAKAHLAAKQATAKQSTAAQKAGSKPVKPLPQESEDEEEGRASAFRSKKRKNNVAAPKLVGSEMVDSAKGLFAPSPSAKTTGGTKRPIPEGDDSSDDEDSRSRSKKSKPGSYLDQILAERSKKKNKTAR